MRTCLIRRYTPIELFPFSLEEYLGFRGEPIPYLPSSCNSASSRHQNSAAVLYGNGWDTGCTQTSGVTLLRTLYDYLPYRDISICHQIEAVTALRELPFYLISIPANRVSFNKL
jgi:predicted AAA+ superfamily ATPase